MLLQNKYTNIYLSYDNYGYLQLLLYNDINGDALFFDGFNFVYKSSLTNIPSNFKEFEYSERQKGIYEIESVKQSDDLSFIRFKNGDIFQIYFMMDDNKSNQILSIFKEVDHKDIITPLGLNSYDAVLKRFNDADECDIVTTNE
jgi:hypothetical protein